MGNPLSVDKEGLESKEKQEDAEKKPPQQNPETTSGKPH
jgi:hypothetical protein